MDNAIEGKVKFHREDGQWVLQITGPSWVLRDINNEMSKANFNYLTSYGELYSFVPSGVTCDLLKFVTGRCMQQDKEKIELAEVDKDATTVDPTRPPIATTPY